MKSYQPKRLTKVRKQPKLIRKKFISKDEEFKWVKTKLSSMR